MGKTSRRALEARKIRNRAKRAIDALERDVAAGVISKSFAARREASLNELIRQNTYDRKSKSYSASSAVAASRAEKVFSQYSAEVAKEYSSLSDSERRKTITPLKEKAMKSDLEAALRGELSLSKMEDAEEFIKSTSRLWENAAPEERLNVIAKKLGYLPGEQPSLIRAYRRWKRYVQNGEDFHEGSTETVYDRVYNVYKNFRGPDPEQDAHDALAREFDGL